MTRNHTAKFTIALFACAAFSAWAMAATSPAALETPESVLGPGIEPQADRPAVAVARERGPTGNPLWGIPLRILTATRERPLFSPSRRPPAPPAVASAAPPPRPVMAAKPEPDHPSLTIVGTVVSENDGIGLFIDQATNDVIRIHTGQNHDGWVLRSVHGREASFEKNERTSTLALPAPGETPAVAAPSLAGLPGRSVQPGPPVPAPAETTASVPAAAPAQPGNTWMDGDGNMITPPPAKLFQAAGRR